MPVLVAVYQKLLSLVIEKTSMGLPLGPKIQLSLISYFDTLMTTTPMLVDTYAIPLSQ